MIAAKFVADTPPPRPSSLVGRRASTVDVNQPGNLPTVDLIELYTGIECGLPSSRGVVVQFVSPDSDQAAEQIGFQLARASARVLGKRILLVRHQLEGDDDASDPRSAAPAPRPGSNAFPSLMQSMVRIGGPEIFLAKLGDWRTRQGAVSEFDEVDRQFDELRGLLDMVIVVSPPADRDPAAVVMSRHVDGNIIVIEAEHSRTAAAVRLRETLARSGRPILGAVMTGRRHYIPRWLARLL